MTPTPAQVAQAEQTAVEYLESLFRAHGTSIGWEHRVLLLADLTDRIASALATAHAEGRQAALEEAADVVGALPFIVPSELEGEEQFNRNGNYIHDDVVIEWLRARAKASR